MSKPILFVLVAIAFLGVGLLMSPRSPFAIWAFGGVAALFLMVAFQKWRNPDA